MKNSFVISALLFSSLLFTHRANGQSLDEQLYHAARDGQISAIEPLLKRGANVEAMAANGQTAPYVVEYMKRTPLIAAAMKGRLEVVALLLKKGANIEGQDENESTALMEAASEGQLEVVRFLLKKGAKINAEGYFGSALCMASLGGHLEVVQLLLEKGATLQTSANGLHGTPITEAAKKGHTDVLQLLLASAAKVPDKKSLGIDTAVTWAAQKGNVGALRLLLENGGNIESPGGHGWTPLMLAADTGQVYALRLLLEKGANLEARDQSQNSALLIAAGNSRSEAVRLLLEKGAAVEVVNAAGETPLTLAVCSKFGPDETPAGKLATIKLLLEKGANIDAKNKDGVSALTCEARLQPSGVVALLDQAREQRKRIDDAQSSDPREAFASYLKLFQQNPGNDFLREKVIRTSLALPERPAVPEEARQLFVTASAQIQQASSPQAMRLPIGLLRKSLEFAPWWGNAYYNLSHALELSEQYDEALKQLDYYLMLNPPEEDAREARAHIVVIKTEREISSQKQK